MMWVPSYNWTEPELGGIPFFYWYQLAWILLGAAIVLIVHLIETRITRAVEPPGKGLEAERCPRRHLVTLDLTATVIFVALFLFVTWIGFVATRWRKADLNACMNGAWAAAASAP